MLYQRKANGKFLLTAEYAVLDGAEALAIPLKRGQWLEARMHQPQQVGMSWQALDHEHKLWFSAAFSPPQMTIATTTDHAVSDRLRQIILCAFAQTRTLTAGSTPHEDSKQSGLYNYTITTRLDFDRNWGLGTSSTLIALVADWLGCDPYRLLSDTFGGSGYDIACAFARTPIIYKRHSADTSIPFDQHQVTVSAIEFTPPPDVQFYFVYLNQKMNSRDAISAYRAKKSTPEFIAQINDLSRAFVCMRDLRDAHSIMHAHEQVLSARLGQVPVQNRLFKGFPGAIKSMGAWGGDFVLAATDLAPNEMRLWCSTRGFDTVFEWSELV